jgi:hypothetical protein
VTGKSSARAGNDVLSAVVGALLLFVVTIPAVSSKIDSLWASEFKFRVDTSAPACVLPGFCFHFQNNRIERAASAYQIAIQIEGVDNVYEIAKELDEQTLRAVLAGDVEDAKAPLLQPRYDLYFNFDENARRMPASLMLTDPLPGRITLAFKRGEATSDYRTLDIARNNVEKLASFVTSTGQPDQFRIGVALAILLIATLTTLAESRAAGRSGLARCAFASAVVVRWVAIVAAGHIVSPTLCLLTIVAVLLPWLAIAARALPPKARTYFPASGGVAAGATEPPAAPPLPGRRDGRPSIGELILLTLGVALFAYMLWFGASFRWSIFEERDFLEARRVLSELTFPIYGPELLLGGHTIGGTLYLLLAPVVAAWNDPEALWLLNRLLFLAMPMVLWWGIRDWAGAAGALFAVFALVASERIVALSYWPIHPNFSLVFAFFYACAVLRGAVEGCRGWLISSGLLLGLLTQLHFSYFLFLPAHVLLVVLSNYDQDRWTKPLAVGVVLLPLAPFLAIDAVHGFPNISQIVQRPRFHGLYPNKPFGNTGLLTLVFGWTRQVGGPFSELTSTLTMLLFGLGLAVGIGSIAGAGRARMVPALAGSILFCVPAFALTILGMGYNTRHTLTMVPALFILSGFGFAALVNLFLPRKPWVGAVLVLPLLAVLGLRAGNSSILDKVSKSEGEWAVDYRSREAIGADLAGRLGLSPQAYAARTFWWWFGWSIDPAIYVDIYRRVASAGSAKSLLTSDQYVLVTAETDLPPFLASIFDDQESFAVGGMYVHVATPKQGRPAPSANADTGVRLHPFLQEIDQLGRQPEGFAHIGQEQVGASTRDLFLGTLAEGRIKLLVTTERSEGEGHSRLRWCVDSPSLNGHYQEIKTIWRPRLLVTPEVGNAVEAKLAGDVLGSLPYKTPRCGQARAERIGSRPVIFAIDGVFDQSFMQRPALLPRTWLLDFAGTIQNGSLSPEVISRWINGRFDR